MLQEARVASYVVNHNNSTSSPILRSTGDLIYYGPHENLYLALKTDKVPASYGCPSTFQMLTNGEKGHKCQTTYCGLCVSVHSSMFLQTNTEIRVKMQTTHLIIPNRSTVADKSEKTKSSNF